eukprot:CAMPEP_0184484854 /NCGR_PEP_ID=MMETSP0113_2-20130426/6531_1 /TAXON_ID=91329 /ORGANISM="Norrisiella sphaerica, Strain BC52" /LENGTH=378 /DNA_ID=CAMNT_0026866035 /DNA_START=194 /DNA_END=1330 /DNA_ORIENTATION=-
MSTSGSPENKHEGNITKLLSNTQNWKINENKSLKEGTRSSIYWTKKTKKQEQSVLGVAQKIKPYSIGKSYKGEWKGNNKHGFGCQIWAKGNKYEGQWEDDMRHGRGTFWVMSGKKLRKQYTGNWFKDLKHGLGVYFYKNGDRYEGEWKHGMRDGKGTLFQETGDQYNGLWKEDKQCGFGRLIKANGDVYRGHWLNGKREGSGIYFYKARGTIYDGEWVNDMPKCGIYCDAKEYLSRKPNSTVKETLDTKFKPIPVLRLKDSESMLVSRIEEIERERFAVRNLPFVALEKQFTEHELDGMRRAFALIDADGNGTIDSKELQRLFESIDLTATLEDIAGVLADLDKNSDSRLSFDEFVRGAHLMMHTLLTKSADSDGKAE